MTSLGQGALNVYDEYRTQIQSVVEAEPLFSDISNEVIDTDFLVSANLYKGDLAVPDEVLQVFFDAIKDATKLRWFTSIWFVGYSERFYQKVTSQDDCHIELITSKEVFDHLKQTRPKIVDTLVNEAQMSFYVGEFSKPYGLWICDDELAGATICSERRINGVITNQTCNAIDWAENQYTHVKQTADQVSHEDNRSLVSNLS